MGKTDRFRRFILLTQTQIKGCLFKKVWIILLCLAICSAITIYCYVYNKEPMIAISQTAFSQAVLTAVFLMMGIEISREYRKENLENLFGSISKNIFLIPLAQIISLVIMSFMCALFIAAGCLVCLLQDGAPWLWIRQSVLCIVLFIFLPSCITGILGMLISRLNARKSAYAIAVLIWLLTSSLNVYFIQVLDVFGLSELRRALNIFNLGLNDFHMFQNISTGMPVEAPRWIIRMAFLFTLIIIYLAVCKTHSGKTSINQKIKTTCVRGLPILVVFLLCIRYYPFFTRFANTNDVLEYVYTKSKEYVSGESVSLNDFPVEKNITVNKCDIDLKCTITGIYAEVEIEAIQSENSDRQSFTLYSDFVVDSVTVNNREVAFERSHDGLLVYYPEAARTGEELCISFRYHGYSLPSFPANETTVQLNRAFPWIPWPGLKTISSNPDDLYLETERFFTERWQTSDEVEYTMFYKGPGGVYTNLQQIEKNTYMGTTTNGVSVYSGMLHDIYKGVDIYVPAVCYRNIECAGASVVDSFRGIHDYCEQMNTLINIKAPKSIVMMQMRSPTLNPFVAPQELYYYNDEWEIRSRGESSAVVSMRGRFTGTAEEFADSDDVRTNISVPIIFSHAVGFPYDASSDSVSIVSMFLSLYRTGSFSDENMVKIYNDIITGLLINQRLRDYQNGCTETDKLSDYERLTISNIIDSIKSGEDYDDAFYELYHALIEKRSLTVEEILGILDNYGDNTL